jgi:hypothetical protein
MEWHCVPVFHCASYFYKRENSNSEMYVKWHCWTVFRCAVSPSTLIKEQPCYHPQSVPLYHDLSVAAVTVSTSRVSISGEQLVGFVWWQAESLKGLESAKLILIMKANEMHYFSNLFDKVLYMFWTDPLSIIRSVSTLYTQQYMLVLLASASRCQQN